MNKNFKVDGKGVIHFLMSRKVVLENRNNKTIIDLQLMWFLIAMIFLATFIVLGLIISLFFGCKISIVDTSQDYLDKNRFK